MNKRYLTITGLLSVTAFITFYLSMDVQSRETMSYASLLPLDFKEWSGREIEIGKRTLEILETNDVLMRNYRGKDSAPVQLCIVYASNNRKVSHPPEVCYKGSGWSLEYKGPLLLSTGPGIKPGFPVIKLVIEKGIQKNLVFYWYKCNDDFTSNYYKQQINIVKSGIIDGKSTSGMIRISTQIEDNEEIASARIENFFMDLLPLIEEYLP
ncbi:MAG: EpsI family protein [Planctomycetes bacterium]|nr:EpsI family protein [Planctomycetota bacterium]